jgi:hypothetical protein
VTDPRRASDELLLQLLRENRHDAEVAVRFGITTGELRERKADLRARLGEERYLALTTGSARGKAVSRKKRAILGLTGAVAAALAVLLVVANVFDGGEDQPRDDGNFEGGSPQTRHLGAVPVQQVDGQDFYRLGNFLARPGRAGDEEIAKVDNRAGFSVVTFSGRLFVEASEFTEWKASGAGDGLVNLVAVIDGSVVDLSITTYGNRTRLRGFAKDVGPLAEASVTSPSGEGTLLVQAWGPGGRPRQVHLEADGTLLLAQTAVPEPWVVDDRSGARLDVGAAAVVGRFESDFGAYTTSCLGPAGAAVCGATTMADLAAFTPELGASLGCAPFGPTLSLGNGLTLEFRRERGTGCDDGPRQFDGKLQQRVTWELSARDDAGHAVSVMISGDGKVYVGAVGGMTACPCLGGP